MRSSSICLYPPLLGENRIPLEREMEETIVFGRKGKNAEKVKWLGVILDSTLRFEDHIASRVKQQCRC